MSAERLLCDGLQARIHCQAHVLALWRAIERFAQHRRPDICPRRAAQKTVKGELGAAAAVDQAVVARHAEGGAVRIDALLREPARRQRPRRLGVCQDDPVAI